MAWKEGNQIKGCDEKKRRSREEPDVFAAKNFNVDRCLEDIKEKCDAEIEKYEIDAASRKEEHLWKYDTFFYLELRF